MESWDSGEAIAVRPVDIDRETAELTVSRIVVEVNSQLSIGPPKTKASARTLVLPAPMLEELETHIRRRSIGPEGLVFSDRRGGPIRRSNFARRIFGPAVSAVGLDGLTFHGLRHSAATQWVSAGIDVRTVQHRLGHSDPRLVLRLYAHSSTAADRAAASRTAGHYWGPGAS